MPGGTAAAVPCGGEPTRAARFPGGPPALRFRAIGLSKALADPQVKVNSICPGCVETDLAGDEKKAEHR